MHSWPPLRREKAKRCRLTAIRQGTSIPADHRGGLIESGGTFLCHWSTFDTNGGSPSMEAELNAVPETHLGRNCCFGTIRRHLRHPTQSGDVRGCQCLQADAAHGVHHFRNTRLWVQGVVQPHGVMMKRVRREGNKVADLVTHASMEDSSSRWGSSVGACHDQFGTIVWAALSAEGHCHAGGGGLNASSHQAHHFALMCRMACLLW